jgi:adenylosuccinate lyase
MADDLLIPDDDEACTVALEDLLAADPDVAGAIDRDRLSALFDPAHHLRHMDDLMERVAAL